MAESAAASAIEKKVILDLSPFLKIYNDDSLERLIVSPYVPPLHKDALNGVSSKDTATVPPTRIFLPQLTAPTEKLPILVHFHAGGFLVGSAFSEVDLKYLNFLSAKLKALIVSVEYSIATERKLPAAYEESWAALRWVCSHVLKEAHINKDPWIANHGDFSNLFIIGDSAGGNIAHNITMRAGSESLPGNLRIKGLIANQPYFWGSIPAPGETFETEVEETLGYRVWRFAYPGAPGGIDSPMINPIGDAAARSLSGLGCAKVLVTVAEKDELKARAVAYGNKVKESEWKGEIETVEVTGVSHCFHVFEPESEKGRFLLDKMAAFVHSD